MSLLSLPAEIISRICRYLGLNRNADGSIRYNNDDLKSVRLTCRDLHAKTTFDAAVRYGLLLEELEIFINHKGLCQLLHITQIPAFRDRIKRVLVYRPRLTSTADDSDVPWIKSATHEMRLEEVSTFLEASEAVEMLSACFRNLERSTSLEEVLVIGSDLYRLIPAALARSAITRKQAVFRVQPQDPSDADHRTLMTADCSPYTKGIEISVPSLRYKLYVPGISQAIQDAKRCKKNGYHLKGYQPSYTDLSQFIANHSQIEDLLLSGCENCPRLRFCDGCHAVFSKHVATMHYPNLTRLVIKGTYISGGRLRRFIKQHSATLKELDSLLVTLTDGSWRSIAQGLLKLPKLERLRWACLFQKHAVALAKSDSMSKIPLQPFFVDSCAWQGHANVKYYLQTILERFCTRRYSRNARATRRSGTAAKTRPSYHEVIMYQFDDAVMSPMGKTSPGAIVRYAKEVLD